VFKNKTLLGALILMAALSSNLAFATDSGSNLPQCNSHFDNIPCETSKTVQTFCSTAGQRISEQSFTGDYYDEETVASVRCEVSYVVRCEKVEGLNSPYYCSDAENINQSGF